MRALLATVLAVAWLLTPLAWADPADGVTWSVAPASGDGPDGRVSLRHELAPGASAHDAIVVTNESAIEASFTVLPGDGLVGAEGSFDVDTSDPRDAGSWIGVAGLAAENALTLDAGESTVLPITISVPADATPGDHPAGIVVGLASEADGVKITHRIGVRLHLRVTGEVAASMTVDVADADFAPSWIPFAPGTLRVTYTVTNTGNVRFAAESRLAAAGPLGMLRADSAGQPPVELLPGDARTATSEVSVWPALWLSGEVTTTPRVVGEDRGELPEATATPVRVLAVSWTGIAVVLALVTLALGWRRRHVARR